jgi:P-type Cu+ transporter
MAVAIWAETRHTEFQDKTFHFCSEKCHTKFKADLRFYASGRAIGRKKANRAKVQYTYPTHPKDNPPYAGELSDACHVARSDAANDELSHQPAGFVRRT